MFFRQHIITHDRVYQPTHVHLWTFPRPCPVSILVRETRSQTKQCPARQFRAFSDNRKDAACNPTDRAANLGAISPNAFYIVDRHLLHTFSRETRARQQFTPPLATHVGRGNTSFSSPTLLEHVSLRAGQAQRGQRRSKITQSLIRMGEREPKMKWKRVPVHAQHESNDKHGNVHDKSRKVWLSNTQASLSVFLPLS